MDHEMPTYEPTEVSRVRLMRARAKYDKKTVYSILDAALMCNVGYVLDGRPYVTPTAFWREGNHLYWHGSSASRALKSQTSGIPVCVTVAHVDGLVLARSGFHSSVNYRAVMAFGTATLVEGLEEKRAAMNIFMDRFTPGRSASNRMPTDKELAGTKILDMDIEEASAKIRTGQPVDDDIDYELPVWAGVVSFKTRIESIQPDPRNLPSAPFPDGLKAYTVDSELDDVLSTIYDGDNPGR